MGNAVAIVGNKLTQSTVTQNYTARVWDSCKSWSVETGCIGGYDYPQKSALKNINGEIKSGSSNVFINGKAVAFQTSQTNENDSWNQPSDYYSGATLHTNATGSVSSGSSTVFINGKPLARQGDNVTTHEGNTTTIAEGSLNVYAG